MNSQNELTQDWPVLPAEPPVFDLRTVQIGALRFGTDVTDAIVLGKPDAYISKEETAPSLLYARAGYLLEWIHEVLNAVTFYVGPNDGTPNHPAFAYCRPRLIALDGTSHTFDAETKAPALTAAFGIPQGWEWEDREWEDDDTIEWTIGELAITAHFNESGYLYELHIFIFE